MNSKEDAPDRRIERVKLMFSDISQPFVLADEKGKLLFYTPCFAKDENNRPQSIRDLFGTDAEHAFVKAFSFLVPAAIPVLWEGQRALLSMTPYDGHMVVQMSVSEGIGENPTIQKNTVRHAEKEMRDTFAILFAALDQTQKAEKAKDCPDLRNFAIMKRSLMQLFRLCANLIDNAKIGVGELEVYPRTGDYTDLIDKIYQRALPIFNRVGIPLTMTLPEKAVYSSFDADKIERMILNILSNCIKFTHPENRVHIDVAQRDSSIEITVEDHGKGLGEESKDLPDGLRTEGLGLSIASAIAALHGGRLIFSGKPGTGVIVRVSLPIKPEQPEAFYSLVPDYKGGFDKVLLEFSQVLDSDYYI